MSVLPRQEVIVLHLLCLNYVRVSTDSVQQEGSLALQKEYYENYIKRNPEYEFIEILKTTVLPQLMLRKEEDFLQQRKRSLQSSYYQRRRSKNRKALLRPDRYGLFVCKYC